MNLIKTLIARIEDSRKDNKNPCKNYATEQTAEKAAEKYAKIIGDYYSNGEGVDVEYVVYFNEAWGRWCVSFRVTPLVQQYGGYVFFAGQLGFYCY